MDQNRVKKIVQSILDTAYGDLIIREFRMMPIHDFNFDTSNFDLTSYCIMILITNKKGYNTDSEAITERIIEKTISNFMGYECSVEFS